MNRTKADLPASDFDWRITTNLAEIGAPRWDALLSLAGSDSPFLRYAFLSALHETGCASPQSGWSPQFLTVWRDDRLLGAVPLYAKDHSYGEYVFDWAWADAYQRHGLAYYPKLLAAIPFSPVTSARLISASPELAAQLATRLVALAADSGVSSLHVLYPLAQEAELLARCGMQMREGVQFHWSNPGYASFEQFLATLERKKRKNIRAERRHVQEAGVTLERIEGQAATDDDWKFFERCYANTYRAHYSTPYLNLAFFRRIGATMPENLLLVIAKRGGRRIASSLLVIGGSTLYGRYWGELEHVPCLHFDCAYYEPLEYCIERGIACFEGGAQGEHKMARGFLPIVTRSAHWLAHPAFASAVNDFLARETQGVRAYVDELDEHRPYRRAHSAEPKP
jgi:predicted N-acyltransferase